MKIVYIDDFFHPDAGYQDNILTKYWSSFGHDVYMIASEMEKIPDYLTKFFGRDNIPEKDREFETQNRVNIIRIPIHAYISGRSVFSSKIFSEIERIKPDIIFINGNDSFIGIQLTKRSKCIGTQIVLDSHMLEMASNNKFRKLFRWYYKKFITPIIIRDSIPVIRTQDDDYVERCLGIPLNNCPYISFGTDLNLFHPDNEIKKRIRSKLGISENSFVVLYAGKLGVGKGVNILANALQETIDTDKQIVFLIIGNTTGTNSEVIEEEFRNSPNVVLRMPTQKYRDLAQYYQCADIALFPKQCSLSFFDVQACGLPVVFEDNNINQERGSHGNALTFKSGDSNDLRKKIKVFIDMDSENFTNYKNRSIEYVSTQFNYEDKAKEYIDIFEQQLQKIKQI